MPDYRITAARDASASQPETTSLVEALIHRAQDISNRYRLIASNLPYRAFAPQLLTEDVAALAAQLGAATWKRIGDEVPSYAFAEKLGRRYREGGAPESALLLHWQMLRRAIHLVLADRHIRTGEGSADVLRQTTLMDYTIDWAIEASLVAYVIASQAETAGKLD
ncbi:MAG: hypothetical protein GWN99_14965 [Gemmatimonadetes bacterium]|uniref:Uncharacterized protein n=1 Tax=Candidatus Kutchimonas denitrificans TaxID=3056748 RepID=A0AAE4Z9M8_9BACT|nr:hypothetical protein [Gemmatimonadota bacterium]NIR76325.1 hypothetical protein [Candidatus Kutchimonas denitrificans]NIS02348.1 hypothetical protein [Gemmatimonadota bacterium]NIT68167.1 hypothetical protein [Gemmatimonadota bacterium]NIU54391.1 hypothetical protein [Gemmatimonadota bacterium]